ncbi:prepilin peptidase [Streptomyces sp. NBC_01235]|uniref:prepilin peptidase n=1 Tax=Streptomyces sp. NBC_01235 TaxID=2903788 RepID=UPI002E1559B3|nr:A24 family peptidase [Streptomyces sp. NBC_01235]
MNTPPSDLALITVAALWGAVTGTLLPRAAYRFSAPWEEAEDGSEVDPGWRATCPAGHPIRGWLGRARCGQCAGTTAAAGAAAETGTGTGTGAGTGAGTETGAGAGAGAGAGPASSGDVGRLTLTPSYAPGALLLPALTALLCAALAAATGIRPELVVWLTLAPVGVLLAVVDLRARRLPDPLTLPLAAAALALLGPAALLPEHAGDWTTALLGALALGAGYLVLHLVNPGGLAFGDVKLALGTGAVLGWYGWATVMLGTFAAFLFGALYGGVLAVVGREGRRTTIAFGPFMLAGTLTGLLIGAYAA